jgi:hypothetical protein
MYFTREEKDGKRLHHSCMMLTTTGDVFFYNEFSFVDQIEGKFENIFADFEMLYLVEAWSPP